MGTTKKLVFGFMLIVCCSQARSDIDTGLYLASVGLLAFDWKTTRDQVSEKDRHNHELNPILGTHPSTQIVDAYFIGAAIAHTLVYNNISQRVKRPYLGVVILLEAFAVSSNIGAGIVVTMPLLHFRY